MKKIDLKEKWDDFFFNSDDNSIIEGATGDVVGNYKIVSNNFHIKILSEYYTEDEEILNERVSLNFESDFEKVLITKIDNKEKEINADEIKLLKTQTGIACEYYVAGELSRLGYNVTLTFGNTKSIDLLIEKDDKVIPIQVKGIQKTLSVCWNLDKRKIKEKVFYVLVNLHVDKPKDKPEFFILTSSEARELFKNTLKQGENRTYLDYRTLKKLNGYQDCWEKLLFF